MSFVHLHVHSEYSLLDGFSNIKKLVKRARQMDMPALALTDHGTMFGVIDFYNAATEAGIKPIIGVESYLAARGMQSRDPQFDKKATHLLLLAENQTGYQNLLNIASAAQLDGFYYYPRVDHDFLAANSEGIICTSGCMSAEVPRLIQQGNLEGAQKTLDWYYETFGPERFFLELQAHNIKELESINKNLIDLGRRYQARFVATNDVHYIEKEDARLQDILLAIQTGCVLSDPNRMRMTDNSYYLRSPEEMAALFASVPDALNNTLLIAERCNVDLGFKGYHLPEFDVPEGYTAERYLRQLCESGLTRRYGAGAADQVVRQRLEYELGIIHQMGFDTYFLIVWDLCRYARERGIWYNARGSAAGSIVAYTLDITLVDPISHKLIFERFLNPGRISMPDIDLDFRDDRRAEMLEYTAHKYGDDKVAQIITFGTLGARAAIRDVGRVMDIPLSEVDRVAKLIPNIPGKPVSIEQAVDEIPDLKQLYNGAPYLKDLIDTAQQMEGVVRNAGTHAAGVIITDKPIIEYIPLHRPTGSSAVDSPVKTVTQFEMSILDSLGLLKVDFLGLATLTIMARACDLIRERRGIEFNLDNIPTDDPETYELLGRGETAGVFQVEGSGMRRWLMQMKPKSLDNVIAMVALFRPGPMDFIPSYIARMHGEEEISYRHPALEPILKETYGITVYQEQIMYTAMNLAGYSASEADNLRKGVAKKKADVLLQHRQKFTEGAVEHGIPEEIANQIFDDWEAFARYGFPKGHAADYGVIAVQTGYLKTHYPVEYMTALLCVNQNDTDKVALYVADCRRMGISVEPPDVNISGWDFTIEDCLDGSASIRFGLGAVKNVGQAPVDAILEARHGTDFKDINDFVRKVDLRHVGKRALESLVKVGALDSFGPRTSLLNSIDRMISISGAHFKAADMGQMSLFGAHTGITEDIYLAPEDAGISRREILNWERELIGLYVSDHPLSPVMDQLTEVVTHFSGQLSEASTNDRVRVAGLVTRIRPHQTKTGKAMGFVTLEDIQGVIELVVFPRTWDQYAAIIDFDRVLLVEGRVDSEGSEPKVLVDSISTELKSTTSADPLPGRYAPAHEEMPPMPAPEDFPYFDDSPEEDEPFTRAVADGSGTANQDQEQDPGETDPPASDPPPARLQEEGETPPPQQAPRVGVVTDTQAPPIILAVQVEEHPQGSPADAGPAARLEENSLVEAAEARADELPPPPDEFPDGWEQEDYPGGMAFAEMVPGGFVLEAESGGTAQSGETASPSENGGDPAAEDRPVSERSTPAREGQTQAPAQAPNPANIKPIFTYAQVPPISAASDSDQVHMITVVLRQGEDKVRDNLRLRQAYGTLISYPGSDRFAFLLYERGRGYQIEFPNFTTGYCQELLSRLKFLVGSENVRIEPLTFQ